VTLLFFHFCYFIQRCLSAATQIPLCRDRIRTVATSASVLGSIPASYYKEESEGRHLSHSQVTLVSRSAVTLPFKAFTFIHVFYFFFKRFGGRMPLFFLFIFHFFNNIHTFIQSQYIHLSPFVEASLHILIACVLSGGNFPVGPSRESNSGLPYSKPTRCQLSHAAPYFFLGGVGRPGFGKVTYNPGES
jgi:hypothetical protein